ncbi:MAG: MG2 domain-containing protein [Acidobacteriota bacterium]
MRRSLAPLLTLALVSLLSLNASTQSAQLRVVTAGPTGEIGQLAEANEIRVIFSEPMVALGRIPANPTPDWIHIQPAIRGTYRWSGTTILIFTPDPSPPLPYATTYTVSVDATATSDTGRALGQPYAFSFTTPTVKLTSMRWYRRQDRFDQPAVLVLRFNQRVRPADVLAHARAQFVAREFEVPTIGDRERTRMASTDPQGFAAFNARVAAARQAANRRDAIALRVATDWNRERFPPSESMVVLETTTAPPPGSAIQVTLDPQVPGVDGTAPAPQVQRSTAELDPVFFAYGFTCTAECDPSGYNGLRFSTPVSVARFASALGVRDITVPASEQAVAQKTPVAATQLDESESPGLEDAGYDRQPPARTFAYRLPPTLQSRDGQTLGYPFTGIVENWHERAFTSFGDGHGVWETAGGLQLPFYSRNFRDITQWLARLTPADLMPRILTLEDKGFREVPPGNGTARRLTVTPDATQSYGIDLRSVVPTGTGLVWAGMRPGEPIAQADLVLPRDQADRSSIVQVTNLGITVKDSPQSTLVFVTRLDNGDAVDGAAITIINRENRQVWRGTTGRDGVAMAPALPLRKPDTSYELSFIVTAEKNGDVAYVGSDWNEGIMAWDFDVPYGLWEATDILRGSIFTDRGVYKPGEEVHVKAIVRSDTPNGIRLMPAGATLDVTMTDSRGREVDRRTLTLTRWSSVEWTWTVPANGTLGNYAIQAALPGRPKVERNDVSPAPEREGDWLKRVSGSFLVAAYRRPDFRVDARLTAADPIAGAPLAGRVEAKYLFGTALAKRPIRWSVTRQPSFDVPAPILERYPEEQYAFGYYSYNENDAQRIAGAEATLDASGVLTVSADATKDVDRAYRYTIEGDVEDVSRQHIANRAGVVVHPAPWYVGLRRPDYFADTTKGTSVDVVAVDLQGAPATGVPVTVALTRVQWNSVRRAEGGGFYTWDSEEVRTPAGQWTITTTAAPVKIDVPVPEGGSYVITATARDAAGHTTKTETSFYALGKGYTAWQRYDHNRITLTPEKKTWKPGERARIMIQSPWESATALMTLEREGVRRYERFALTSTQQTLEVPISEDDIPNVYVSVLLIRGRTSDDPGPDGNDPGKPAFKLGYAELKVEDAAKHLSVAVTADRKEYRPANTARVSVALKDVASRPVAGEVTLWAVDYGVLSLTDYRAPDVLSSVYQHKSLQVMNEDNRQRIVSRRVLTPKGEGPGGGGGADAGANETRRDFRPLAFWLGSVETDASGAATREFALPESLTTYRIMAVAADSSSRFGSADAEINVTKPVTLLAAFPRFMTMNDRASFGAVVTNTLATGGPASVTIRSLDPAILQFQGSTSQTVQLAGNGTEPVRFMATARSVGTARVRVTVTLGTETDAFESTFPVTAPAPLVTRAAFGDTDSRAIEKLALPAGILPGIGGLNVQLASTALVGLGEGARYLVDYPFGCAEQKASAALALTLAADLGNAFTMGRIAPADYRARASSVLGELPRYQCENGGFTYWAGACSSTSVYLTSYLLHVMKVADGLGMKSDADVVTRALDYLEAELKKTTPPEQVQWLPVWSSGQAFSVKVLSEYGRNQDSNITRLVGMADRLPVFALSYLADAIATANRRSARYDDIVRRITNAVRVEGDQAHVEEANDDALAWVWSTSARSSALVLEGMVRRGDDPVFVQRLVRWLLAARRNGRWGNTQENAMALESLVAYYRKFEADVPDMTATVAIAARPVGTATFRGRSSTAQQVQLAMPDLLRQVPAGAERELALSREGAGRLFYSARVQYSPTEPLPAGNAGIRIERAYERYVENGAGTAATAFSAGDLIRVSLTITLPQERRYVAVSDPILGGAEAVDGFFRTTASDLARDASSAANPGDNHWWFERDGFDHVDKFDDRVELFATRLSAGRHTFSYLVRATTAGTFRAAGTSAEQMYAPEVSGRAAPSVIEIR